MPARPGLSFALRHARREAGASMRRLGAYMLTITLGVAALVAINSYRANAVRSVAGEARSLLGADLRLESNRPLPATALALVDTLVDVPGAERSTVLSTITVAVAANGRSRLSQVRAVEGTYPFYGELHTSPEGRWGGWGEDGVLAEPSLLRELGIAVGDSMRIGRSWLKVRAAITDLPPEINFQNAFGPRLYLSRAALQRSGIMAFGSLARHQLYVKLQDEKRLRTFADRYHDVLRQQQVSVETAQEQAENMAEALDMLGRFLGLIGLAALLLGGLGVGSAVHVFVRDRRDTIAVLRCLGARRSTAFGAYLLQAVALGLAGAAAGVLLGIIIQFSLPAVLGSAIPFEVTPRVEWNIAIAGLLLGGWVAFVFALLPLLGVRTITPLRALRQDVEAALPWWRDPAYWGVLGLLLASIAGLSIWQIGLVREGLAFTAALLVGLLFLWLTAALLVRVTRRIVPRRAAYELRQGVANLYRPQNQTTIVTMAVGFGVFIITALLVVQSNLLGFLDVDSARQQPNVVALDVQPDQVADVQRRMQRLARPGTFAATPIIPARIAAVKGVPIAQLLQQARQRGDTLPPAAQSGSSQRERRAEAERTEAQRTEPQRVDFWAVRREYRHSYRATLNRSEKLIAGKWWPQLPPRTSGVARVSAERDVARSLGVGIGDHITWDIQGQQVETVITSLREVNWATFGTNFFFLFEPGVLDSAPQTWVALARVEDAAARSALQREVITAHPNVSVIDVALLLDTIEHIIERVTLAIRFMGLFSVVAGIIVLIAALASGRYARVRETALLRTIGARNRQVRRILLTEYAALGALAGLTGILLGGIAGFLVIHFVYRIDFELPILALLFAWGVAMGVAVLTGSMLSRDALRRTPLATLREALG